MHLVRLEANTTIPVKPRIVSLYELLWGSWCCNSKRSCRKQSTRARCHSSIISKTYNFAGLCDRRRRFHSREDVSPPLHTVSWVTTTLLCVLSVTTEILNVHVSWQLLFHCGRQSDDKQGKATQYKDITRYLIYWEWYYYTKGGKNEKRNKPSSRYICCRFY